MAQDSVKQEDEWEVEEAARTLMKAEEIKRDDKMFKKAQAKLKEQQKAITKAISGIERINEGENKGRYRVKKG